MRRARSEKASDALVAVVGFILGLICLQLLTASEAGADEGQDRVRADIKSFVRARIATTEAASVATWI